MSAIDLFDRLICHVDNWGRCPVDVVDLTIDARRTAFRSNPEQALQHVRLGLTELCLTPRQRQWQGQLIADDELLEDYPLWDADVMQKIADSPEDYAKAHAEKSLGDLVQLAENAEAPSVVMVKSYETPIVQYVHDGVIYLQLTGWLRHQKPETDCERSDYPACYTPGSVLTGGAVWHGLVTDETYMEQKQAEADKRRRKRKERESVAKVDLSTGELLHT